ncbi:hypothetical protein ACPW96_22770 [Micromonospora sp. DT81.3]|uniref:hypothetical protein n=1 Tax=Micromonospora sp. DT81.3 TaxID=3416523 RepID=UPI003CEDCEB5
MTRVVGAGLLASAFAPLVALLAILKLSTLGWIGWGIIIACAVAVGLLSWVLRGVAGIQSREIEAVSVTHEDERVLAFTSSYVVPVVVALFSDDGVASLAATLALVLLLGIIYVRAGLYHLNPTLAVLGYRLYAVTATTGAVTMLLSKTDSIPQKGLIACRFLGENVAIQLKGPR